MKIITKINYKEFNSFLKEQKEKFYKYDWGVWINFWNRDDIGWSKVKENNKAFDVWFKSLSDQKQKEIFLKLYNFCNNYWKNENI